MNLFFWFSLVKGAHYFLAPAMRKPRASTHLFELHLIAMSGTLSSVAASLAEQYPSAAEPINVVAFLLPFYTAAALLYLLFPAARAWLTSSSARGGDEEGSGSDYDSDGAEPGTPERAQTPEQRAEQLRRSTRRRRPAAKLNSPYRH